MKPKVIVIVGPTASGKTSASIKLAKQIGGEIISADSMQIYKEMTIGTAKPTIEEMEGIPHYLIDVVSPDETFNVTKYKEFAEKAIEEILAKGKTPIIVGGTGLYVSTLINGIEFAEVGEDFEYRDEMTKMAEEKGSEYIHDLLKKVDPDAADAIEVNNVRRVIRALEIYKLTGKTKTELDKESRKEVKYDYKVYGIETPREELYNRINVRVDKMFEEGLLDEVRNVKTKYKISSTAIQGLGYKEVIEYIDGKVSYDEMVDKLKMETRRYAKRQLTWFRREEKIKWFGLNEIVEKILEEIAI
ncbi:MAG: tRNA (adenosine(37)-N6)-dimethylallyltransferase MiaA [Clostridia bacterium]|nr:tRNA (adenosine(37)-N6)-dimethylallyltransferase MiaA [Clostridia bacterium]